MDEYNYIENGFFDRKSSALMVDQGDQQEFSALKSALEGENVKGAGGAGEVGVDMGEDRELDFDI